VFLASISTILGAVLFLRFGYSVAQVGFLGTLAIILIGHMVTIPTALAIAEISTNRRVEGGGEYFIISRSFGTTIGGAIGVSLYLSQAVSVAFYMIAFAEAFRPFATQFTEFTGMEFDARFVSVPATLLLGVLVITKGASLGVKALWGVTAILAVSLTMFSLGHQTEEAQLLGAELFATVEDPDAFMIVFAIVFPAFTGMTAGVGLSGDLANPRKSIPLGVMSATVVGMFVYVWVTYKLASSATPLELANDQLIMQQIAVWGPIILIGLAGATISSAIGSILVAPRTMQALAMDRVTPLPRLNRFVGAGVGENNEPRNATLVTLVIALATVSLGNVDAVAAPNPENMPTPPPSTFSRRTWPSEFTSESSPSTLICG
jgi:amino acid transporter